MDQVDRTGGSSIVDFPDFDEGELGERWIPVALWMPNPSDWEVEDGVVKGLWSLWNTASHLEKQDKL